MRNREFLFSVFVATIMALTGLFLGITLSGCGSSPPPLQGGVTLLDADEAVSFGPRDSTYVDTAYRLSPGDELSIDFLFDRTLSTRVLVRPDGGINLPILGDVIVSGKTPGQLAREISDAYGRYYTNPQLAINLSRVAPPQVYVLGEVTYPKAVEIRPGMTVLAAIAQAGGQTQFGSLGGTVLVRRTGMNQAVARRVDPLAFAKGKGSANDLFVQDYDIIYVPRTLAGKLVTVVDQIFSRLTVFPVLYLRGWESFNTDRIYNRPTTPANTQQNPAFPGESP